MKNEPHDAAVSVESRWGEVWEFAAAAMVSVPLLYWILHRWT